MKLEDAIDFWVTETGYRLIQTVFSKDIHGESKYAQKDLLKAGHDLREARGAIETLKAGMEPSTREEIYFRGSPSQITETHRREGFFAVALNKEKATTYGDVYIVRVHKDVPRLRFGAEGGEVLLSDGMVYMYEGKTLTVRPPSSSNGTIPYLGNLYVAKISAEKIEKTKKSDALINLLYCYSFETPDDTIGYLGDCEASILEEFQKKSRNERIELLKSQLRSLPDKSKFLSDVSFPLIQVGLIRHLEELSVFLTELESVAGGGRKKQRRKSRRVPQNRRSSLKAHQYPPRGSRRLRH